MLADLGVYGGVHTLGHGWRGSGDTVCHVEILQYLLWWRQRVRAECSVAYLQQNGGRRKYYKRQVNSCVELHTCNEKNRKKELKSVKSMHKHLSCQDSYPQEYMTVRLRPQAPPKIPPTQNRTTYHQRFHNTEQDSLRTTKDSTHTEYASLCTTKDFPTQNRTHYVPCTTKDSTHTEYASLYTTTDSTHTECASLCTVKNPIHTEHASLCTAKDPTHTCEHKGKAQNAIQQSRMIVVKSIYYGNQLLMLIVVRSVYYGKQLLMFCACSCILNAAGLWTIV